jgi:hypothetical protein
MARGSDACVTVPPGFDDLPEIHSELSLKL